jgi:hypothetical protein
VRRALREIAALFPSPGATLQGLMAVPRRLGAALRGWVRAPAGSPGTRLASVCGVGWIVLYATFTRYTWVWGLLALAVPVAAMMLAPDDHQDDHQEAAPKVPPAEDGRGAALWGLVEEEVAAAVHNGRKGERAAVLLEKSKKKGLVPTEWEEKQFKRTLQALGIPVREQMHFRVNGKKANKVGVHVQDLTQALGRAPRLPAHLVPDLTPGQEPASAHPSHHPAASQEEREDAR